MKKQLFVILSVFSLLMPSFAFAAEPEQAADSAFDSAPQIQKQEEKTVQETTLGNQNQEKIGTEELVPAKKPAEKVKICHVTGSAKNRFVYLEVAKEAVDGAGKNDHTHHERDGIKDIIPITDVNHDGLINQADCDSAGGGGGEPCSIKAPTLVAPVNGATNLGVHTLFKWTSVAGATAYELQISTNSNLSNPKSYYPKTNQMYLDLKYNQKYFWRIRAIHDGPGDNDCMSCFTPIWCLTTKKMPVCEPCKLNAPVLVSPANWATNVDRDVTFDWQPVAKADLYHLQVSTKADFSTLVVNKFLTATEFHVLLEENTQYYWRVMAIDKNHKDDCDDHRWEWNNKKDCESAWTKANFTTAEEGRGGGTEEEEEEEGGGNVSPITTPISSTTEVEGFGGGSELPSTGSGAEVWIISMLGSAILTYLIRRRQLKLQG